MKQKPVAPPTKKQDDKKPVAAPKKDDAPKPPETYREKDAPKEQGPNDPPNYDEAPRENLAAAALKEHEHAKSNVPRIVDTPDSSSTLLVLARDLDGHVHTSKGFISEAAYETVRKQYPELGFPEHCKLPLLEK
jgi:hypothetical protein